MLKNCDNQFKNWSGPKQNVLLLKNTRFSLEPLNHRDQIKNHKIFLQLLAVTTVFCILHVTVWRWTDYIF